MTKMQDQIKTDAKAVSREFKKFIDNNFKKRHDDYSDTHILQIRQKLAE